MQSSLDEPVTQPWQAPYYTGHMLHLCCKHSCWRDRDKPASDTGGSGMLAVLGTYHSVKTQFAVIQRPVAVANMSSPGLDSAEAYIEPIAQTAHGRPV